MTQAEEMRRLLTLMETVEVGSLTEIGRLGRAIGAGALSLAALAGGSKMATAQPVTPQTTMTQAQRITPQNHMQLAYDWFKSLPQDIQAKALSDRDIGQPVTFIQRSQEVDTQSSKDSLIDQWVGAIEGLTGQQTGPRLDLQTGNDRVAARRAR